MLCLLLLLLPTMLVFINYVSIGMYLIFCHLHLAQSSSLFNDIEFNHNYACTMDFNRNNSSTKANSRVGIFTFNVALATKTKLPVHEMQNTKSWMLLQSQEPRSSQLFHMSCAPLQSFVNFILASHFHTVSLHDISRFHLVPRPWHHVCSSITLISCWL